MTTPPGPRPSDDAARLDAAWPRLEPWLDEALDLPLAERAGFLARVAAADAEAAALLSRLWESDRPDGFLKDTAGDQAPRLLTEIFAAREAAAEEVEAATAFGPYAVVRPLGRGGSGNVYLARRADGQFEQQVAIKVLRAGLMTAAARERFLRERQILARLSHDHIARLVDGGLTDRGVPWFALDYVEGLPLTRFAREGNLARRERLRLFAQLGAAVQYLHRNLLVHRDLKPGNVLVTPVGQVRLLDFGVSRWLDDLAAPATDAPTVPALTPEYAAPEQILGLPTTTGVDVFALGVLLYELLTDRTPFPAGRFEAVPNAGLGRPRPPAPADLGGDLDAILKRALASDPRERYASVEALLDDLDRHATGQPVLARAGGFGYQLSRSLRRHRGAWAALALVLLSISVGLATTAWQARRAERQAARAEAVRAFLVRLFENADPEVARGKTLSARELLDQGAERVRGEFAGQPQLRAEILQVLGDLYGRLGQFDRAHPLLSEAWSLRRTAADVSPHERISSLNALAWSERDLGRLAAAESLYRECLRLPAPAGKPVARDRADTEHGLSLVLQDMSRSAEAESLARHALAIRRGAGPARDLETATSLGDLATIVFDRADYPAAIDLYRESLSIYEEQLGPRSLKVAAARSNLATALLEVGNTAEATPLFEQALAVQRQQLGADHPRLAWTLNSYATVRTRAGDQAGATRLYRETVRIQRLTYGDNHPEVAKCLHDLGRSLQRQGDFTGADSCLQACLGILRHSLGERHPYVGRTLRTLGDLARESGRLEASRRSYEQALDILRATLGPEHDMTAEAEIGLGRVLMALRRPAEAESLLRHGVDGLARHFGADDPRTRTARDYLEACRRGS